VTALALIVLAVVAIAAVIGLAAVAVHSRIAPGPTLAERTLIVHTRRPDDQSLRGVLVAQHADRLTLREVAYLHAGGTKETHGLVHVPLSSISWMQEIEPDTETS
jgi:hypothetical protein